MTYEQVRTLATQYESATTVLVDGDASPAAARAAAMVVACMSLVDLEAMAGEVCRRLTDRRMPSWLASRYARSFGGLQELIAAYRAMLNMPPGGAQA
jgi:hypothetical protein